MKNDLVVNHSTKFLRLPLLGLAILTLLAGMWAGLIRLGWGWPVWQPLVPTHHGPLMIGGFLGTLIGLERAIAIGRRWAYLAPALTALGALVLVAGIPGALAPALIMAGSAVLLIVMGALLRIQFTLYMSVIAFGVVSWLVGNLLWLTGQPIVLAVPWWIGFLIFTIAGERLELSRLLRLSNFVQAAFLGAALLLAIGLLLTQVDFALGIRVTGAGMVALALWLLRYDIAQRRLRVGGQARFIAISLLAGYGWLLIGGLLTILYAGSMAGPYYDAMLHTLLLGFVFSMIFAHAPIIFPAVLQVPLTYTARFYSHLLLLHLSVAWRVTSDLLLWQPGRLWSGLLNVLVLLFFLYNTVTAVKRAS